MKKILFFVFISMLSIQTFARSEICRATDEKEIASLFERWNDSLKTGSPEKVADNYALSSILLPTLSNQPRITQEEKIAYFKDFLKKKPLGKINDRMIQIGCNTAFDSGLYTFTFDGKSPTPARYTYTYAWNGEKWLITSHHSSLMPEK